MSYTRTFSIKLLPSDTGLSLTARILTSARAAVTTDASAIELSGGEYSWTYTFTDNFIGYVDFYSAANTVFQTSTAIFPPDANVTSVNENSTAADNIQAIYDGVTGAPAKFTTLTTSGTTTLNALTVSNATTLSGQLSLNGAFGANGAVYINNTTGPGMNTNGSTYGITATGTTKDIFLGTANLSIQDAVSDAVWDEVLTSATHNVPTSAGRRLRNLGTWVAESGTAQGASSNYITLQNSASSSDHYYDEQLVVIIGGTLGVGQVRMIKEYIGSSRRAYVDNWTTTPTGTIEYELLASSFEAVTIHGLIVSATANTAVIDGAASTTSDYYLGQQIVISGGTGAGQARYIDGYDGLTKTLHVYTAWVTIPDATSLYQLTPATGFRYTVGNINANTNTLIGTPIALDGGSATVSSMLTKMADDNNGLDFNSTTDSLNKIQTFVSSAVPTGYPPTSATRIHGTNSGGTFSDLAAHDEVYMVTTEDIADGLEIEIVRNVSPIALTPSVLRIIGYYSGDPGHSMFVNIYNYLTSSYNTIGQMLVRVDAFDYSFPLTSDNQNILTGEMKIQLVHDGTPFDAGDILYLDQVIFEKLSDPSSMDSVLASIKSKTDQLNFILGDVIATLDGEVVASNLVSIDGQLTSLNNAILNLKQLNIKSDGNLSAIDITGSGSGDAMKLVGGATGTSINAGGDIDTSTINQIQNGLSLTSDVTTAVTNINAHTDINLDAKVSTRAIPSDVTTAVTNINAHTDINLDAKVSTRSIPSDITTAVTNINAHTDVNLDAKITSRATPSDVTTATGAVQTHGDTTWITATGFSTPTQVAAVTTNVNAHTDVNLDAKVSTRATPADVIAAWDEPIADHLDPGSTGEALNAASSGLGNIGNITSVDGSIVAATNLKKALTNSGTGNIYANLVNDSITSVRSGLALTTDVTTSTTNINNHTDVNLDAKVSTRATPLDVTTAVTDINAHTDVNLDAKITSRATPADVTTAVTDINAHTDTKAIDIVSNIVTYDVDSTGGEVVSLSKAIEVILAITGGKSVYNPVTMVWEVYGRDGTTIVFQGKTHGQGNRSSSNIV